MTQLSAIPMDYVDRQITSAITEASQPLPLLSRLKSAFADPQLVHNQAHPSRHRLIQDAGNTDNNNAADHQRVSEAQLKDTTMEDQHGHPNQYAEEQQANQTTPQLGNSLQSQIQHMQWQPQETAQHSPTRSNQQDTTLDR